MRFSSSVGLLAIASSAYAGAVQKPGLKVPSSAAANRDAVQKLFVDSYNAYREFAFGHDDLSPVSKGFSDGRNGFGATIVDALPTIAIMGLDDLFEEALNFTAHIDFSKSHTPDTVSVFETTIRYLGGLLSAFELSGQQHPILVEKAKEVADKMAFAWVGDNLVPFGFINFATNTPTRGTSNIAEAGTLALEWSTLTKHTGNATYANKAVGSLRHIATLPDPLPGLAAQGIDPATGKSVGAFVTWGGGSDSYFEYLIKYARLSNTDDPIFADTWATAVDSSIKTLLRTSTVGDFLYVADFDDNRRIRHVGSHLACFHGGNWILGPLVVLVIVLQRQWMLTWATNAGGKLLNNQTIVDLGLNVSKFSSPSNHHAPSDYPMFVIPSCSPSPSLPHVPHITNRKNSTGIGPESFAYISDDGSFTGGSNPSRSQLAFNAQHGFYITGADYILRPEVLESNFYAWRVTGDTKYLDNAARAIDSFNKFLPATVGIGGLFDVNNVNSDKVDDTESFWFAEVLKYLYLTFDDPDHISIDDFVFNTEAQPFIAPTAKATYGSGSIRGPQAFKAQSGNLPVISPNRVIPRPLNNLSNAQTV
ncbi:hypothetical protein ONZ45_g15868 [Pleurotus djamor]|nr:hypothetical protein ONZ45_g15868 [Pleurotus djamor]